MGEPTNDAKKFRKSFEITYEDFFLARFMPMLGCIKKFMSEFGEDRALSLVTEYIDELAVEQTQNTIQDINIENFAQFKIMLMKILNTEFMRNCTSYQVIEDTESQFKLRFTKCLWAKTFTELKFDGEKGHRTACRAYYTITSGLSPNVKLSRTKTLMQGDECCELCYKWEK